MSRTPDVVDGGVVQTSWGNEIRDRSLQVFANATEINAWAAPNGSLAVNLSTNRMHLRLGGAWRQLSNCLSSFSTVTTNASSDAVVTHGLGITPGSVICTPSWTTNNNTSMLQITDRTATTFTVRCRNFNGVGQANTTVGIHWMVAL